VLYPLIKMKIAKATG